MGAFSEGRGKGSKASKEGKSHREIVIDHRVGHMRSARRREQVSVAIVALAMATTGTAGARVSRVLHTGAGVARREAYHARRADERAVLQEVDAEAALRAEAGAQTIVRVEAGSIVVEADGANYTSVVKRESKKVRSMTILLVVLMAGSGAYSVQ